MTALDGDGLPMLSLAAASGHLECIEVLVENSADVNAQTKRWDVSNSLTILVGSLISNPPPPPPTQLTVPCSKQQEAGEGLKQLIKTILSSSSIALEILHCTSVFTKGLQELTA